MDYFMNILYNDSNLYLSKIDRMFVYVFSTQLADIRHGSYCKKEVYNTSGMENTPMEKHRTSQTVSSKFELLHAYLADSLLE